ncbi:MAG: hypothetical protein GF364_04635 [Candidatus Lokiarchaeota archaeon]|nr:hypothetical protein [Candidatus Lokiarchaeota archaeon]
MPSDKVNIESNEEFEPQEGEFSEDSDIVGVGSLSEKELWSNIGFHRPLGGFFYKLPLTLIEMVIGLVFLSYLIQFLYPYPEPLGYRAVATGIFALMIEAFNLGTANMMNRFIGESNVKDPEKMVEYIQYFIWYQMFTGLIQTTFISIYALFIVPHNELAYAIWILLIFSTTEYPGMLGVFRGVLDTLQQYNKTAILGFISGQVFQKITEIGFVLWGRYYGINHPEIGEIMGIAIGASIGFYVDDFVATLLSAYYFQKVMKDYGFTVRTCFRHDFDSKLFKECLSWGIRSGLPSMIWGIVTYVELLLWLRFVPQYTTFKALFDIAGTFSGLMGWNISLGGSISEAFFNDKRELAKYYVGQAWRYTGLIQFLMIALISVVTMVLEPAFIAFNIEYQILAIPFILPRVIREIQQPYNNIAMNVISSTGHVNFQAFTNIVETTLSLVAWIILIPVLQLPDKFGITAVIWMLPCAELPGILTKIFLQYLYLQKKVLKLRIPFVQAFLSPIFASATCVLLGYIYVTFVFTPMIQVVNTIIAIIPAILFLLFIAFFVYFPLTGFFGGWDDGSLDLLEMSTHISGMGKTFSKPLYKLLKYTCSKSKLHNKYGLDETDALREVRELMILRNKNLTKKVRIGVITKFDKNEG